MAVQGTPIGRLSATAAGATVPRHRRLRQRRPRTPATTKRHTEDCITLLGTQTMTSNEGFAAVAEWIALDADNETFIFRKFDKLAARRLLYMQARIITLEKQLELLDKEVVESKDMSLKDAAKTWEQLMAHAAEGHEQGRRMLQLLNEIDEALEKFCKIWPCLADSRRGRKPLANRNCEH